MSPLARRVAWWVVVGAAQVGLMHLACKAAFHRTVVEWIEGAKPGSSGRYIFDGWPIAWSEYQQGGEPIGLRVDWWKPVRTDVGPIEFKGRNPTIPVLLLVAAVCLPPLVMDRITRRRGPDGVRPRPSRSIRTARVLLLGSMCGLTVAAADLETEYHVFHVGGSGGGWRQSDRFGPTYFLDKSINSYRERQLFCTMPDGTPIYWEPQPWINGSESYQEVLKRAIRLRHSLTGEPEPTINNGWVEPPTPESMWEARSRLTVGSTVIGVLLGCALFRPWRRPAPPAG